MDSSLAAQPSGFRPPRIKSAPRARSTLGLLRVMVSNPIEAVPQAAYEEGCVRTKTGGSEILFLTDPALVEAVLVQRHEEFPKSDVERRVFEPLLGHSLLTLEGQDWRWQRRLAAPAFRPSSLMSYLPAMRAPFEDLAQHWARSPGLHSVDEAMTAATIDVVCRTFFSGFGQLDARRISDGIGRYLAPVSWTIAYGSLGFPALTPHPGKLRMRRAVQEVRRLAGDFVAKRRRDRQDPPDLAQTLIDARDDETGRTFGDNDLLDLFLTLIAAGHETSANALSWALYCLAAQPERQEALAGQVRDVLGDGPVRAEHIASLAEVRRFLEEAMRLFPAIPLIGRRPLRDCRLGGEAIRAGSLIFIPIYAIHRHRALWSDPDLFDPDRFQETSARDRPRCAYMPFGAGPRICIGAGFAMLEMVVGLASMLARVRVRLEDESPPSPVQRITLRPQGGMVLRLKGRG